MKNNKEREKGVIKQNQEVISEQARAFSSLSKCGLTNLKFKGKCSLLLKMIGYTIRIS